MKRHNLITLIFIFLTFSSFVKAGDVTVEKKTTTSFIGASLDFTQMTLKGGSITGNGFRINFDHYFSPKMAVEVYLSTAINTDTNVSNSFTGIGGYGYYTLLGNCCDLKKVVSHEGVPILVEKNEHKNSLQVGAGIDQFFLNGTKSVYSISGLGVGANYHFPLFGYHFKAYLRYSMMSANKTSVTGIFLGLGINFGI